MKFIRHTWLWAVATFLVGLAAMYIYMEYVYAPTQFDPTTPAIREAGKYMYTAPLLLCPTYDRVNVDQNTALKAQVQKIINEKEAQGSAEAVSVYYRSFAGDWFGFDENAQYNPASLLKVPLMIAYFREAEDDPAILKKEITYDGSFDQNATETFKSDSDIKPGTYTVDNLIKAMIVNSDNNAVALLTANIDPAVVTSVYTDLGLSEPTNINVPSISPKQYMYFFRILYNSTYLTPEYSEKALELLAGPDFPQGIQATVPSSVAVANKFGERSVYTPQGQLTDRELHDCGIVYAPKPYLICIMTRGQSFQGLVQTIQAVSSAVYQAIQ